MFKKFVSICAAAALMFSQVLTVSAATTALDIGLYSLFNEVGASGRHDDTYTVQLSGNYVVTLSGMQGCGYMTSGGKGTKVTKTVWLNAGDTIRFWTRDSAINYQQGATYSLSSGYNSYFYVNDVLNMTAGGGAPVVGSNIAPDNCTTFKIYRNSGTGFYTTSTLYPHWHDFNNVNGPYLDNVFETVQSRTEPEHTCNVKSWHVHDSQCTYETWHTHEHCVDHYCVDENGNDISYTTHNCTPHSKHEGDTRDNRWDLDCEYEQGQIIGLASSYTANNSSGYDTITLNANVGGGAYSIYLADIENVQCSKTNGDNYTTADDIWFSYAFDPLSKTAYTNIESAVEPVYETKQCKCIILDDTVVYFKRE